MQVPKSTRTAQSVLEGLQKSLVPNIRVDLFQEVARNRPARSIVHVKRKALPSEGFLILPKR
jgi:hypothetical protein